MAHTSGQHAAARRRLRAAVVACLHLIGIVDLQRTSYPLSSFQGGAPVQSGLVCPSAAIKLTLGLRDVTCIHSEG